jgi:predicted nucleic acid-binding Zn ribbon protein
MPIYEYVCPKCKTEFEVMRPFSEDEVSVFPDGEFNLCYIPYLPALKLSI